MCRDYGSNSNKVLHVSRLTAGQLLFNRRTLCSTLTLEVGEDTLGVRGDLLGRAAKESTFNSPDLYLSAVEMEIFAVVVGTEYLATSSGKDRPVFLMQLKRNFV